MLVSCLWLDWQPVFVGFSAPEIISGKDFFAKATNRDWRAGQTRDFECEKPMAFWNSSL